MITDFFLLALNMFLGLPAGVRTLTENKSKTRWTAAAIATTFWFFGAMFLYYRDLVRTWPGKQ